jgi:hypothetical protein
MFGSRTIARHIARGTVGFGAVAGAVALTPAQPLVWLVAIPVAALAFRGCPMCWTVGLAETVAARVRGVAVDRAAITCTADGCGPAAGSRGAVDGSRGAS